MENIFLSIAKGVFATICLVLSAVCWFAIFKLPMAKAQLYIADGQVNQLKNQMPDIVTKLENMRFDKAIKNNLLSPNVILLFIDMFLLHRAGKLGKLAFVQRILRG